MYSFNVRSMCSRRVAPTRPEVVARTCPNGVVPYPFTERQRVHEGPRFVDQLMRGAERGRPGAVRLHRPSITSLLCDHPGSSVFPPGLFDGIVIRPRTETDQEVDLSSVLPDQDPGRTLSDAVQDAFRRLLRARLEARLELPPQTQSLLLRQAEVRPRISHDVRLDPAWKYQGHFDIRTPQVLTYRLRVPAHRELAGAVGRLARHADEAVDARHVDQRRLLGPCELG